ncbi:Similar to Amyloid beta A4 precursor protein-binding family B member 1-interacting protein; acc. no. Q7Z5R6 [Pyronema omphalodes CBS 100304]|uniref:Similar to Amyloid beta A4 protein-binding family B member 1-interacting protein acc. no. Q7Z5R6 n=1 Tax=Pyronema omphalodes (strain CBS 100304) TaxID=1076935 RepID=U4LDU4_PYROM|nr:Similar to Amyloid beta A4 precursor protein-binding family B member 1-interacting protein; acc. no. Q7Z5R6 [Pyronema omphalodes CBS 100304]
MTAQDPPRAPPPSRYKTVRRKPVGTEGQAPSQPAAASYPPSPAVYQQQQQIPQSLPNHYQQANHQQSAQYQQPAHPQAHHYQQQGTSRSHLPPNFQQQPHQQTPAAHLADPAQKFVNLPHQQQDHSVDHDAGLLGQLREYGALSAVALGQSDGTGVGVQLERAVTREEKEQPQEQKLQRNQSRLRKMLRLNTRDTAPAQHAPQVQQQSRRGSVASPPGSAHAHHGQPMYKSASQARSPERNQIPEPLSAEDIRKQAVRDEALAKLEGKPKTKRREKIARDDAVFDLTVTIRHDKHGPTAVPILQNCDVATMLEKLRPGHERCILECWPSLGVQRQVRYFEVLTDVMNSWDQGGQSFFKLGKNIWNQNNLQLSHFPASEPMIAETNFYYYVTADKKWSKRSLSVSNGSLHIIKRDSSYGTKEHQTINLDNFDIYFFCDNSALSKLRAPTNFTFALKSQHKQSLFGKNSVYVHYFSIDNEMLFTNWYTTIAHHKARLIAEKNQLATWTRAPVDIPSSADPTSPTSPQRGRRHPHLAAPPQSNPAEVGRSKSLHRNKSAKPGVNSGRSTSAHPPAVGLIGNLHQDPFTTAGLLGQGYDAKKAQAMKHFKEDRNKDGMLQSKQTAMRNHAPTAPHLDVSPISIFDQHRTGTMTSTAAEGGIVRRATTSSRPTTAKDNGTGGTLLSFSAAEINTRLPHHAPRSRSNTMTKRPDGPLLGGGYTAQPGEDGIPALPIAPGSLAASAGGLGRRPTTKGRGVGHQGHQGPLIDTTEDTGFTGVGLLAGTFSTHGVSTQGHGVRTGRDVKQGETLLNMGPQSMFQPGSLLARREMETGIQGPRIDRSGEGED